MMRAILPAFYTVLLLACAGVTKAQYSETIESGRPGQDQGATTVGAGVIQLQAGGEFYRPSFESDNLNRYLGEAVLRIGIFEHFELGALWNYHYDRFQYESDGSDEVAESSGFSSPEVRARVNLHEQNGGFLPTFAVQAGAELPVGDGDYTSNETLPFARVMAAYSFFDRVQLTLNYRIRWFDLEYSPSHRYVGNIAVDVTQKFGVFAESYGDIYKNDHESKIDYGIYYVVNDDLQLDFSAGGHTLNNDSDPFFINAGVSWRVRL